MSVTLQIKTAIQSAIAAIYNRPIELHEILINETKPEFEGDFTMVTFALSKQLSRKPDDIAQALGEYLTQTPEMFSGFNVIKGFLNLSLQDSIYLEYLNQQSIAHYQHEIKANGRKVMVEFSSPNTNKPLHFGHLRNIFLGDALSRILLNTGHEVIKANLINDRGIHICKSMLAWIKDGKGDTPESTGIKGDHLVGDYYVRFNELYKEQVEQLVQDGLSKEDAEKKAPLMAEAQEMLRRWEQGDPETLEIWTKMNGWVYDGFYKTYDRMGIRFDKMYYESQTYLLGKTLVEEGLQKGLLFRKEDGSVWIDLSSDGLDQKLLLRGDGTSVYMTQDLGTAKLKYDDFGMDTSVYVIGDEQNYHMQVLKLILQKLHEPCADGIHHLSYGMVELPTGRMKSREGTVVDADDMMDEMISIAKKNTEELGKVEGFTSEELSTLYHTLGLGALKFYLLRVDPKKKMIFNPQESIDFHGFTGPFVQYTYARICSILRKAGEHSSTLDKDIQLTEAEKTLLKLCEQYPEILMQSAKEYNPAVICNYCHLLAKTFNGFLVDHSILKAENETAKNLRLKICQMVKSNLSHALGQLGIAAPERM
ncbi:MAG: arginine--tRNA ligase [Chitinophagaceae bacterium]|nr:arginine--tRNA ligase [Chitinophagaceae bacterium]